MSGIKARIMIVEDEYVWSQFFKAVLEREGYEIVGPASTAHEAIELLNSQAPDVVCMDIGLEKPGDGIALARRILEVSDASIVFVSGYQDGATKDLAMESAPAPTSSSRSMCGTWSPRSSERETGEDSRCHEPRRSPTMRASRRRRESWSSLKPRGRPRRRRGGPLSGTA